MEENLTPHEVKTRAVKSVKWTASAVIVLRAVPPIVTLILARLLCPADFGIVAIATIFTGLAVVLQDFGLGKTLVQREDRVEASANVIFWMGIALGLVLYLVLFIASPLISEFFHEPRVTNILRVLCLQVVIISFLTVPYALLQRVLHIKPAFFVILGGSLVHGTVSISMALMGMGVWALVYGTLAGSVTQAIILWKVSPWRPKWSFDISLTRQLVGFSIWVALETFLTWVILSGDFFALGYFLGVEDLGIYRVGVAILTLILTVLCNPIISIAYPAFSRLKSNPSELKRFFLEMIQLVAAISLPLTLGLVILAKPGALLVLGSKWQGIEIVIAILAVANVLVFSLTEFNFEVYRAVGRPDINTKLRGISIICYLPVYVLAAPHGLLIFCLAKLGATLISVPLHLFAANRVLHWPFTYLWQPVKIPLVGAILMGGVVYGITNLVSAYDWFGLILAMATGALSYLLALWVLKKELVKRTWQLVMAAIR